MIASTPGMPAGDGAAPRPALHRARARRGGGGCLCRRRLRRRTRPRAPARSAVSATITDVTPGTRAHRRFGALAHASHCFTAAASTVIEKNTLPSVATISESFPVAGSGSPSGLETLPSAARTSSFKACHAHLHRPAIAAVNLAQTGSPSPVDGPPPAGP